MTVKRPAARNATLLALAGLPLAWYAMMAFHELGHVLGAVATGGTVQKVVLHPLAISRTDVAPNPGPGIVVWLGPLVGCAAPAGLLVAAHMTWTKMVAPIRFLLGFCLIANGAYIGAGGFWHIGDAGDMLATGTPLWAMVAFGVASVAGGFALWHGASRTLGWGREAEPVTARVVATVFLVLFIGLALMLLFSDTG